MIWRIPHHGWKITTWNSQQDWAAVHLQGYREIFWFPSSTQITPSGSACNLGVVLENQLSFTYLSNLTRSCRLLLYIIRRIWPFFSREITHMYCHLLVISWLEYSISLLAVLPLRAIRHLRLNQKADTWFVFNFPKFFQNLPHFPQLSSCSCPGQI